MLRQLVLVFILGYVSSTRVDRCSWGESYWCSSLKIAKQCGAVDHCINTVWAHQKLSVDDSDTCSFCENIVNDVKNFIDNKQTQEEVQQFLDAACSVIPDADLAKQCQQTVDTDLPEIYKMIDQELDPQVICATIGLCSGFEDLVKHVETKDPIKQMQKAVAEDICTDCKTFFTDIKNIFESKETEQELEQYIDQALCSQLGGLEDTCKTLVQNYVPEIIEMLESDVDPGQICQAMGFCNSTKESQKLLAVMTMKAEAKALQKSGPKMEKVAASTQCVICEFVIKEVDSLLADNATEQEIVAALDKVCSILPSTISSDCENFVNTYGPAVLALLQQEMVPSQICSFLGLCSNSNEYLLKSNVKSGEECVLCMTVMQYVDSLLQDQKNIKEIEQVLDKVCNFLPSTMGSECTTLVNQYAPIILQLLPQELTPTEICGFIGLCSNSSVGMSKPEKIVPQKVNILGVDECTWGPSYWCLNGDNAKRCKAEEHCRLHVWN